MLLEIENIKLYKSTKTFEGGKAKTQIYKEIINRSDESYSVATSEL